MPLATLAVIVVLVVFVLSHWGSTKTGTVGAWLVFGLFTVLLLAWIVRLFQ
jgi:hypothetical protein